MSLRRLMSFLVVLVGVLTSSYARAEKYQIAWDSTVLRSLGSCGIVEGSEDAPYFIVNGSPRMTYMDRASHQTLANGDEYVRYNAEFDSSLLVVGNNTFKFQVNLGEWGGCDAWDAIVWLIPPRGFPDILFSVTARGAQVVGETTRTLTLGQIRPQVAADYSALLDAINANSAELLAQASNLDGLAASLDALANLKRDVEALLKDDVSLVTAAQFDALLQRYPVLPPDVRAALEQLLADYKAEADALTADAQRLISQFASAAGILNGYVPSGLGEPTDPTGYAAPAIDAATMGPVVVPDITPDQPGPASFPAYDAYATAVLSQLNSYVLGEQVRDRHGFLAAVRSWRTNQAAIQRAFDARTGVSQQELQAFLNAQFRVTSRVRTFLDNGDWFKDVINVPQALRVMVDTLFPERMPDLAPGFKDTLNDMPGTLTERQEASLDLLESVGSGLYAYDDGDEIYDDYAKAVLREVAVVSQMIARTITSVIPGGIFFSACEAITGWPACNQTSTPLSVTERAQAGGDVLASTVFWGATVAVKRMVNVGTFTKAAIKDYKATFFAINPSLEKQVWVHHAVEQVVLRKYPGRFTEAELHSYSNLRGIPRAINSEVHLKAIRIRWNQFYKANRNASRSEILAFKDVLDKEFGHLFNPPYIPTE